MSIHGCKPWRLLVLDPRLVEAKLLRRKLPGVAPASLRRRRRSTGRQVGTRDKVVSPSSDMPVQIEGQQRISCFIQVRGLHASRHGSAVVTTRDLDVEGLGPELPVPDSTVVVDRHDLSAQDVVSVGDGTRDLDALLAVVVVEDGVGAPVSGVGFRLAAFGVTTRGVVDQGALVDLEELERRLVDVLAVAVAGSQVRGGPAVVAAVPAGLISTASALVEPGEGYVLAGGSFDRVWRR